LTKGGAMHANAKYVVLQICDLLRIQGADVISESREVDVVDCRHLCVWFLWHQTWRKETLAEVGRWFGRSHGFVLHSLQRVEERRQFNVKFRAKYLAVSEIMRDVEQENDVFNNAPQY
jgi:chromosomal replication initiation ATPase DnaA